MMNIKLFALVLLLVLASVSFAKASDKFDFSKDKFVKTVIDSTSPDISVEVGDKIEKAQLKAGMFKLADVEMKSKLGDKMFFKGKYLPIFKDCFGLDCDIYYEFIPSYSYSATANDFIPQFDGDPGFSATISHNVSAYRFEPIFDTIKHAAFVSILNTTTGNTTTIDQSWYEQKTVGSKAVQFEDWSNDWAFKVSSGQPIKIRIHVHRQSMSSTADVQIRAAGELIKDWGIFTNNWLYSATLNITTGTCDNLINWPFPVNISNTNSTLFNLTTGDNIRFTDISGNTQLQHYMNPNTQNSVNGTYWVAANWTGNANCNATDQIVVWAGNTAAAGGSNGSGVFNTGNFTGAYLFEDNPGNTTAGNFTDASGQNHGNNSGFNTWNIRQGKHGRAYQFNSTNSTYIPLGAGSIFAAQNFSVLAWMVTNGTLDTNYHYIYATGPNADQYSECGMLFDASKTLRFSTATSAGAGVTFTGEQNYQNMSSNTHLSFVGSNNNFYYFRNSSFIANQTILYNCSAYYQGSTSIGRPGAFNNYYLTNTVLDELFVLKTNITKSQITSLSGFNGTTIAGAFVQTANTTTMGAAGTGVSPIYTNSPISWNASASTDGGVFRGFNWSIYKNGVNTTSGNYTCNGGFCSNSTTYVVQNDSPSIYSIGDQLIFSARAYTTDSVGNSTYLNSSTYTVVDNRPIITNLLIAANSTTDTIYPNMTIYGNLTAQDNDTSQTLTASYSWYKNGLNQTALAGTLTMFNGTANTTPLNCLSVGCVAGDSWIFGVQVNDTLNWTAPLNTTATVISAHISNLTMNSTTQEYDLYSYSHGLNFTSSPGMTISSVSAGYGGSFFVGTLTSSSGGAQQWNVSIQPPFSDNTNNYTVSYIIMGTYANGSSFTQVNVSNANTTNPYTIRVNASGLYACNSTVNTPAINYSFYDESTLASINATLNSVYAISSSNGSLKTTTFSITNVSGTLCVGPSTGAFSTLASESLNASGYNSRLFNRPLQTYNSTVITRPMGLLNTSLASTVIIIVTDSNLNPLSNYTVILQRYYPGTNSYNTSSIGTTDTLGQTVQFVQTIPTQYAIAVLNSNGILQTNITTPPATFCGNVPPLTLCTYNIILGNIATSSYYQSGSILTSGTGSKTNAMSGSTNVTFEGGPFCSLNNNTLHLSCTYNYGGDPAFTGVNLTLRNSTGGNFSYMTSILNASSGSVWILVPNFSGIVYYGFGANYLNSTSGSSINFTKVIETGYISMNQPTANQFGPEGWLLAMLFVFVMALVSANNPGIMILLVGGTFILCAVVGLISLSLVTFTSAIIITAVAFILAKD